MKRETVIRVKSLSKQIERKEKENEMLRENETDKRE